MQAANQVIGFDKNNLLLNENGRVFLNLHTLQSSVRLRSHQPFFALARQFIINVLVNHIKRKLDR